MKYIYEIKEISKDEALGMVKKYHYSNTLAKLNKLYVGFFLENKLVGVVTLGWGTRPRHTIQRLFPSLDTKDYYEIGRMCMTDDMPRNSESQMLSQLIKWLKVNHPQIKVLFTWADGMVGKCGYVYQSSSFYYCGHSVGEEYLKNGVKIHVRQMKSLLVPKDVKDERITVRPNLQQMQDLGIEHYKGKQYAYLKFLCNKREKKKLMNECLVELGFNYPKDDDLKWTKKNVDSGKWESTSKPPYITDCDKYNIHNLVREN